MVLLVTLKILAVPSFTFDTGTSGFPWIAPVFADLDGDGIDELYVSHHASGTLASGDSATSADRGKIITIATDCPAFPSNCNASNGTFMISINP